MQEELDPFDYDLALALSCTVAEMRERIGNGEYLQHRALAVYRVAQDELARKAKP
jgi:hypothetical protein